MGSHAPSVRVFVTNVFRERVHPLGEGVGVGDLRASVEVAVTGEAAGTRDFNHLIATRAPLIFAFVLGFAFLLMLVTFRSIVIPVKAIAMNLLSVGAAYAVLVWVFQDGPFRGCSASRPPDTSSAGCRSSCS